MPYVIIERLIDNVNAINTIGKIEKFLILCNNDNYYFDMRFVYG